ncbi:hypothetical protein FHS20_001827 [Phyllobacterium endophyticum]|nr:hypothetical protein [Phyllobacterium endophyticum]
MTLLETTLVLGCFVVDTFGNVNKWARLLPETRA